MQPKQPKPTTQNGCMPSNRKITSNAFFFSVHQRSPKLNKMALQIATSINISQRTLFRITNLNKRSYSSKKEPEIPKNELKNFITADQQPTNGVCYDKKPFRMVLQAGKRYSWCLCGRSHNQPMCDGTHKNQQLKIQQKPIRFEVAETKEYWLCNCKQTRNRPFCDGTHLTKAVEEMTPIIKP